MKSYYDIRLEVLEDKLNIINEEIRLCYNLQVRFNLIRMRMSYERDIERYKERRREYENNSR